MLGFVSTKGGGESVDFETAILQGFAPDGGLFVPEYIPQISIEKLRDWSTLSYGDLAFEIISLFVDKSILSEKDLKHLLDNSFNRFDHPDIIPVVPLDNEQGLYIMELFHGPTLSFKDVAMGFLINLIDFFLERKNEHVSIVVATTGDTGPAAAHASIGKKTIDSWLLYPRGMISEEQERQITTLEEPNIHPVGVDNCPDGGDDLDLVIAKMFEDQDLVKQLKLTSVNSINWGRVMVQAVHYFYGYFRIVKEIGENIVFSVPSGAFGNMFGGYLARTMGLPVEKFICANNQNSTLHQAFSNGKFSKKDLQQTLSSAIDIVVPYNFWRYLYFVSGQNSSKIRQWMDEFNNQGEVRFDEKMREEISRGFISTSISDEQTLSTIEQWYRSERKYLLDPHSAVAVSAVNHLADAFPLDSKVLCLATAHPAKFPDVIRQVLNQEEGQLPNQALHQSIEAAKEKFQHLRLCDCDKLGIALQRTMKSVVEQSGRY